MISTGWRGLQCHAYILYLASLVTFADWPAEFIIGQSLGDITAVINIRMTRSSKRENTISDRILVAQKYIESETSTADIITKRKLYSYSRKLNI